MAKFVIYDSLYGNTEQVARAIADVTKATLRTVDSITISELRSAELIIVGSPTQGGRPTAATTEFLHTLPRGSLRNVPVAAFDTRFELGAHGFWLTMLMKLIGFASPKIASALKAKGGRYIGTTAGFVVTGKQGPLRQGELLRAASWARDINQVALE